MYLLIYIIYANCIILVLNEMCTKHDILERCWLQTADDCNACGCCYAEVLSDVITDDSSFVTNVTNEFLCARSLTSKGNKLKANNQRVEKNCSMGNNIINTTLLPVTPIKANGFNSFVLIVENFHHGFFANLNISTPFSFRVPIFLHLTNFTRLTKKYLQNMNISFDLNEPFTFYSEFSLYLSDSSTYICNTSIYDQYSNNIFSRQFTFNVTSEAAILGLNSLQNQIFINAPSISVNVSFKFQVYVHHAYHKHSLTIHFEKDGKKVIKLSWANRVNLGDTIYLRSSHHYLYRRAGMHRIKASVDGTSLEATVLLPAVCAPPSISIRRANRSRLSVYRFSPSQPFNVIADFDQGCSDGEGIQAQSRFDRVSTSSGDRVKESFTKVMTHVCENFLRATLLSQEYIPGVYQLHIFLIVPFANLDQKLALGDSTWLQVVEASPLIHIRGPSRLALWEKGTFYLSESKGRGLVLNSTEVTVDWFCYLYNASVSMTKIPTEKYQIPFHGLNATVNGASLILSNPPNEYMVAAYVKKDNASLGQWYFHKFQFVLHSMRSDSATRQPNDGFNYTFEDLNIVCLSNCFTPISLTMTLSLFVNCIKCNYVHLVYRWELHIGTSNGKFEPLYIDWQQYADLSAENKVLSILPSTFHWTVISAFYKFLVFVTEYEGDSMGMTEYDFVVGEAREDKPTFPRLLLNPYNHSSQLINLSYLAITLYILAMYYFM